MKLFNTVFTCDRLRPHPGPVILAASEEEARSFCVSPRVQEQYPSLVVSGEVKACFLREVLR